MKKRFALILAVAAVALGAGAAFAFGGGNGLIWDDDHFAKPGSLDDGKDLLPQTRITLAEANAAAQRGGRGPLGQVDLESRDGRIVFSVDVGDHEVRVDATSGSIVSIEPRS